MKKSNATLSAKGAKIVGALTEFRDALASDVRIQDRFTVRTVELDLHPHTYSPDEVRGVRDLLGMSQPLFASFLGVDTKTVRSWEQGKRNLSSMACRFLDEIASDPDYWRGRFQQLISSKDKHAIGS